MVPSSLAVSAFTCPGLAGATYRRQQNSIMWPQFGDLWPLSPIRRRVRCVSSPYPVHCCSAWRPAPRWRRPPTPVGPQGVPPGADPATGARPGNDIGTGMSMPMGNTASNINPTRHALADCAEPAVAGDRRRRLGAGLPDGRAELAGRRQDRRGAAVVGDGGDPAAGPVDAAVPDQHAERQPGGVADLAGTAGARFA